MVCSINDLAKQMGKHTVAEFVENTVIIDKLIELGVNYAQGYIIGRPKPLCGAR
ncbi:EAL domain-containing protein [Vibrio lentus]|nr:EAL domain-containing protein [Vibrio lentus]